ncbi:MAG TPA: methyltransferase domain-containing protein, partial [Pseudomonadales bacterium]|nr:methyltransferase domain-containing protein [Pseudomonadales bacterium]
MRKSLWKYINIVMDTLPITEPIYEFGSYQVEGIAQDTDLRPLFTDKAFVGCDMRAGPGVDKVLNLHHIDLPDNIAGTVFLMDTLEHVEYPHQAVSEIYRILKPGGLLVMSSVLDYFIHETPNDYWRYTPDAFRSLLKPFQQAHVGWYGPDYFPQTVVGIGIKEAEFPLADFEQRYAEWNKKFTHMAR